MAENYSPSRITAVSDSHSQRRYIEREAVRRRFGNLEVVAADMNVFGSGACLERVVSVELFEHMRSWRELLRLINTRSGRIW